MHAGTFDQSALALRSDAELHRSPPPEQFVADSPLERTGFEPPVPLAKRAGLSGGTGVPQRRKGNLEGAVYLGGDRRFESHFLHRRIT